MMGAVGGKLAGRMLNNRWMKSQLWRTGARWGGTEVEVILARFKGIPAKKGAEIVLQTLIRMAHKFITGPVIVKFLTKHLNMLEKIIPPILENSKSQSQFINDVVAKLEKDGIATETLEETLNSKKKEILREIEKDLKKAA